jgi:hypothetical protein
MASANVALIPKCAECAEVWLPADEELWAAFLTDDEPSELVFYCSDCAEREFERTSARDAPEADLGG